jgi:acyl-CoA thioesterase II
VTDAPHTAPDDFVPDPDPVASLLAVLNLSQSGARTTEDIFTGVSQSMPLGRVYGGQVLAQSLVAAERTIPDARSVHSMHGYFLRPGDASQGITFAVDRIHDGRSFSTRRTQAFQQGVPIFSMIASFQDDDPGIEHHAEMPTNVPQPEDLPDLEDHLAGLHPMSKRLFTDRPLDIRHIPSPIYLSVEGEHVPRQAVWMRTRRTIPDDPRTHRAALAYLSDLTIQESILRAHGVSWATPGLKVASLDHAMWWHRPGRVDDWMLYVQESPNARGGRGLATGRIFSRDGLLVASVAQEIMVRVPGPWAADA